MTKLEEVLVLVSEVLRILKLILEAAYFVEDLVVDGALWLDLWLEKLFQHIDELDLLLGQLLLIDDIVDSRISLQDEIIQLPLRLCVPHFLLLKSEHIVDLVFLEGLD